MMRAKDRAGRGRPAWSSGSKPLVHDLLSHQTSLMQYKSKQKIKDFKTVTGEH